MVGRIGASRLVHAEGRPIGAGREGNPPLDRERQNGWIAGRSRELAILAAAAVEPRNPGDSVTTGMMAALRRGGARLHSVTGQAAPGMHRA